MVLKASMRSDLVETLAGAHRALNVERADVLPVLLEEGNQEIDGQTDVGRQIVGLHGHVTDGNGQTQDLEEWGNEQNLSQQIQLMV